jgi:two-component system, LytTR family, sensor kinase
LLVASGHLALAAMPGWLAQQKPGFVWGTFAGVIYYWMIVLTWWSVMFLRLYRTQQATAAKLEASLADARLDALRAQLQPHFLFNTLNAISVLADEDPSKAKHMLLRLADLLRLTLAEGGKQEVRLSEELELLEHYLDIQRVRFEDRLTLRFDVTPAARDAFVPVLLLQPLVENAIRHGVDPSITGGTIAVIACRQGDALRVEVRDNGRGLPPAAGERRDGVGLANTRARLATLYGERQRLELVTPLAGGAAVVISLPFRTSV